jgi:RNA polymerase sigma-70 factor (ECF subfamily)
MADNRSLLSSFAEHRSAVLRFLRRRLGNAVLAEDLTQETWLRAANAQSAAAIDNPRGYLFSIASNLALDHQRHVGHRVELQAAAEVVEAVADRQPSPENVVLHRSEFARLLRVVDQLSPRCREVFVLGKFEGLSLAEIGQRLGISRNTVATHMVNALAAIEREMVSDK